MSDLERADSIRGLTGAKLSLQSRYKAERMTEGSSLLLEDLKFLLEGVALDPALNQEDGIHPNAAGARKVAEGVWTVLEPQLKAANGR